MRSILRKTPLLLTGVMLAGSAFAQTADPNYVQPFSGISAFSTWSVGVNGGIMTPYTIFRGKEDFINPTVNLGYGAYIKDQLLPSFGIQLSYMGGQIGANNSADGNYKSYNTKLSYGVDLTGQFTLANISWMNNKSGIQPYVSTGFGLAGYTPTFTDRNNHTTTVDHQIGNGYIPVGIGAKFNVSPMMNVDLGYQVNFIDGDNLDGYDFGTTNDKFSYAHLGLEFALDGKGKHQLATHNPVSSMRDEYMMAEDRLRMAQEAERAREEAMRRDLDAERADLAATKNALNQTNAALARFTMDSDGDGVPDFLDKCPNTPAGTKVDGSGCPLVITNTTTTVVRPMNVTVTEADRAIVKEAIRNLEFDFNKATIRPHSFPSLDRVAQLLIDKGFHLKLAGYTDNVGSQAYNLKLSRDRAESVKNYLVSKNADAAMITSEGYGKEHPIASNKTAKGRQINRRVEFTLY